MLEKKKFYINGEWVVPNSKDHINVINPSDEKPFAVITLGNKIDTDDAVHAARNSFLSWTQTNIKERIELLENLIEIYSSRSNEMGAIISQEMGAPIDFACRAQAGIGGRHTKDFIAKLKNYVFDEQLVEEASDNIIIKEAIGVCGLITPWNWPMNQITLKVIPALGVGCTVVLKPSEISPLSSLFFAEMIDAAGFPAGVFNLINGDGAGVGSYLTAHADVDMISFTGSTRAGSLITKSAAETVKRVSLELGGKGANIIFADADNDAVSRGIKQCFMNSGQSYNAPTRMLVQQEIYDDVVTQAINIGSDYKVAKASQHGGHLGPVVSKEQYDKIQKLIKTGLDEGARLIVGGLGRPEGLETGYYIRPTIFTDVNNQMCIAREEIFGPVLSIIPFVSEEEAIEIANDSFYGLTHYIQTQDINKAQRVTRALRSGMVEINGKPRAAGAPFGGYKRSGNGREGGVWGIDDFLEVKSVSGWV